MDALSEVLDSVQLGGAVFYNAEFTAPWGFRSPPSCDVAEFLHKAQHVIIYHLLLEGRAQTEVVESAQRFDLGPGDIVVFPHGHAHIISNGRPPSIIDNSGQLKAIFSQGITLARAGGGGESTRLVCGYMGCDQDMCRSFLTGLPPMFKVNIRNDPAGQWLENSIKFSAGETVKNRSGSDAVLSKLSEALFIETMRRYMAELPEHQTGWLAGARDPAMGEALASLHRAPEYAWTIANLAAKVGVSRSALAEKFRHYLGEPPMTYLSRWRLRLGARMLTSSSYSVARIAGEVGYESEPAFNRAFKREYGAPPARFRAQTKLAQKAATAR